MNGFTRIVAIGLFVFGLICATDSFGNVEQYSQWSEAYSHLGIHPTPTEIRAKCKALGMDASQAANFIAFEDGEEVANSINTSNNLRDVYLKVANLGKGSRSKTTVKMAERVLALLDEVNAEKKSRNVNKFLVTDKKLKELMGILPNRTDSENNVEKVAKMIDEMNGDGSPLVKERAEFLKEVDAYFDTSKNEDFDTAKYVSDLIARFNDHIHRVDARIMEERAQGRYSR